MAQDARFEDGDVQPLRLRAEDGDDLQVVSTLLQDAICPASEMKWRRRERRFAVLVNRFRWEDSETAKQRHAWAAQPNVCNRFWLLMML